MSKPRMHLLRMGVRFGDNVKEGHVAACGTPQTAAMCPDTTTWDAWFVTCKNCLKVFWKSRGEHRRQLAMAFCESTKAITKEWSDSSVVLIEADHEEFRRLVRRTYRLTEASVSGKAARDCHAGGKQ